jgi:hypothetical protein
MDTWVCPPRSSPSQGAPWRPWRPPPGAAWCPARGAGRPGPGSRHPARRRQHRRGSTAPAPADAAASGHRPGGSGHRFRAGGRQRTWGRADGRPWKPALVTLGRSAVRPSVEARSRAPDTAPLRPPTDLAHDLPSLPDLRLPHRRRRQRRLGAGQPAQRRPRRLRRPAGSRAGRPQRADPLPGRPGRDGPHRPGQLVLRDHAPARAERPARLPAPGQGAGRLQLHQRDDLHPRPPQRLRRLGRRRQPRLGLGRRAALVQAGRGQRPRRRRLARPGRPAARDGPVRPQPAVTPLRRGGAPGRLAREPGLQRRRIRGRRDVPGHPQERRALQRRQGLSAPHRAAPTCTSSPKPGPSG